MNTKNGSITNIFLAVELDDDTKHVLARKLFLLDYKDYLRLEPKRNLHVTLGYIRDVHQTERRDIINAFKPLKECEPFSFRVESAIVLGVFKHMLCVSFSPDEPFLAFHNKAKQLLAESTEFKFDDKYPDFIPHAKIQTIRKYSGQVMHDEIVGAFEHLNFRKLEFKAKALALMYRADKDYLTLYRYEFKKKQGLNERVVEGSDD